MVYSEYYSSNELYHHGIKGQKWGVRRYQNSDGSLTSAGRKRYGVGSYLGDVKSARKKYHSDNKRASSDLTKRNSKLKDPNDVDGVMRNVTRYDKDRSRAKENYKKEKKEAWNRLVNDHKLTDEQKAKIKKAAKIAGGVALAAGAAYVTYRVLKADKAKYLSNIESSKEYKSLAEKANSLARSSYHKQVSALSSEDAQRYASDTRAHLNTYDEFNRQSRAYKDAASRTIYGRAEQAGHDIESASRKAYRGARRSLNSARRSFDRSDVGQAVNNARSSAYSAYRGARRSAIGAYRDARRGAGDLAGAIGRGAGNARRFAGDAASDIGNNARSMYRVARRGAGNAARELGANARSTYNGARRFAGDAAGALGRGARSTYNGARRAVSDIYNRSYGSDDYRAYLEWLKRNPRR